MGSKYKFLFSRPPKGTSLREMTAFDVMIVKISAGVLAVRSRKNQKIFRTFGDKRGNRIVIKFCIGVITHANFGDYRFRVFFLGGGAGSNFPLFHLLTLSSLKHQSVISAVLMICVLPNVTVLKREWNLSPTRIMH